MFLNNTRLFAELEGSMDVQRKEQKCLVKEFAVGVILECKTHEIRDVPEEFIRGTHPDETNGRGNRMEVLLTSGGKHNRDVVVVWTLGHQETEKLYPSSITFLVALNIETNTVLNLNCNCEIRIQGIACHVGKFINNSGMHGLLVTIYRKNAGFNHHRRKDGR